MSLKFGQTIDEIKNMLLISKKLNVIPYGISFHVGSQNNNIDQWILQLEDVKKIFNFQNKNNINLQQINIGGGFPITYDKNVISIENILLNIKNYIKNNFNNNIKVYAEPGRYLVQESGTIISKVILSQHKDNTNWIYIDQGIYQGLLESLIGIKYKMVKYNNKKYNINTIYNVGGPTCDGMDILGINVTFDDIIKDDDVILIKNTGQYTFDTNTKFNGIKQLKTIVI